jgi:DNA-binding GntR family transcriptional regulator
MKYQEHCKRSKEKFGKNWEVVHRWLDEFARQDLTNHRRARHHKEGVAEVRKKWGEEAALVAEQHILDDMGFVPLADWYNINWLEHKNY